MTDYTLPDGNIQISFSGGRTSGYMLHQILEANGNLPDRVQVLFANTGREMPETLEFVRECQERWGVKITWVEYDVNDNRATYRTVSDNSAARNGEPFEVLIRRRKYLPNIAARFCTTELKILPMKRYLTNELGWKQWTAAVGIRADESKRAKTDSKDRWSYWYPLLEANISKKDVVDFWDKQAFNLNLGSANGVTPKGNCDFCFLKSEHILASMAKQHPERAEWWIKMEQDMKSTFRHGRDMKEFVDFATRQQDWIFDEEGYFCQQDEGECTG